MSTANPPSDPNKPPASTASNVSHAHQQHAPRPPPVPGSTSSSQHPHPGQAPPQQQTQHQAPTSQQQMSESNKRAALAGQWRTPPLPVFPTSVSSNQPPPHPTHHHPAHHHPPPPQQQQPPPPSAQPPQQTSAGMPAPTAIPDNSEDYAKALQEAYRRGAEAAAAMAAQQQHMSPSASCPNFQIPMAPAPPPQPQQPPPHGQTIMASRSEDMTSSATAYSHPHAPPPPPPQGHAPAYHYAPPATHPPHPQHPQHPAPHHAQHPQHPAPHHTQHPAPASAHQYAAPPPPPPAHAQYAPPVATTQSAAAATTTPTPSTAAPAAASAVPNPLSNMPPPAPKAPPPARAAQPQPAPPPPAAPAGTTQIVVPPPQQRSVSLPDMTSYAVQAEEEKRQKRLARNRASARLRRLRKKNLVDAYETEVGILEKTLQQLKAHEWGVPTAGGPAANTEKSHQSLLEALCMDRGQQVISSEQRAQQCQDILEQQLQQMELLRQVQFEQQLLAAASVSGENKDEDPELAEMAAELNQILGLSDDQKAKLQEGSKGLDDEMTALDTVFSSLVMMKENEWLLNQGVQDITDQLTSILHKNQMSKFLLWADANVEAIDQLDHVHAAPKTAPHPQGPIFTFGVETTPMEDEGDGK